MEVEVYNEVLEVVEISKAVDHYAITLDVPRNNPKFKSFSMWANPPKPMIIEFNLTQTPPIYSKVRVIVRIVE